jgi:putative membrane protein
MGKTGTFPGARPAGQDAAAFRPSRYPLWLLAAFAVFWLVLAIKPLHFKDWLLENVLTVAFVALLLITRRRFPLSNVSYTLIFVYLCLHTIGAHYTYSRVPYDKVFRAVFGSGPTDWFGWRRNHFDRLVHFCFGFLLAYPIREMFLRIAGARGFWGYYLPLDVTMSFSMVYELIEWGAAMKFGGDLGQAYLGTQGDEWDAHKDMALASAGALIAMTVVAVINYTFDRHFGDEWRHSLAVKGATPLGEVRLREMFNGQRSGNGNDDDT